MTESPQDAYDRGSAAGKVLQRLADHDTHFSKINGSLAQLVTEMHALTLAVQRLGDQAVSRDATVLTTAAALKDAEEARRDRTEQSWSPVQKVFAVIAALAAVVGIYLAIRGMS